MPELPEVETTVKGIQPHVEGRTITQVIVRHPHLRWPIPANLATQLTGSKIQQVSRRAKYLLLECNTGTLIIHLGMSGSLRILPKMLPPAKHDHVDIVLKNKKTLRFRDPRRFGAILWEPGSINQHPLFRHLGIEPLTREFTGKYLSKLAHNKKAPIKSFIMDNRVVVGVGNIYATEALFLAKIHPLKSTQQLSLAQFNLLAKAIKTILKRAIEKGGTTLKDFIHGEGKPGYFTNKLKVYGRENEPCTQCSYPLKMLKISQRSTVFCTKCQI